jgi:hypothetical protein
MSNTWQIVDAAGSICPGWGHDGAAAWFHQEGAEDQQVSTVGSPVLMPSL